MMNMGIGDDVLAIVQDEEWVAKDRAVDRDRRRSEHTQRTAIEPLAAEERLRPQMFLGGRPLTYLGAGLRGSLGAAHFV